MTWAFFYPLAWLGALAIAAPVWLHLRRRVESTMVRFSAVQFLDDQPLATRAPLRLHNLALLALRILALLFLCTAFAWPYLPDDLPRQVSESQVHILDNTLSHQAERGFEKSRDTLAAALVAASPEQQIAVIELTALPRVVVQFGDRREDAPARVRALVPSSERGSYLSAFRMANGLLSTSLGERRRIVFWSDSQSNQWDSEATVPPFLERVDFELPSVTAESRPNAGVSLPRVQRAFIGERARLEGEVTLHIQGKSGQALASVRINGQELVKRKLSLADAPDTLVLAFQWEGDPHEWVRGEVQVEAENDSLAGDNRAWFAFPPVREGRVVLLARSPFLQAALAPEVMQGRWVTIRADATALDATALRDADALCLESRYLQSADARRLMNDFLARDRGVFLLIDHLSPVIQAFLRDHGIELRSVVNLPADSASFRYVFMQHPIFHPFRSPDFGNLLDIRVHRYRRLAAPQASPLVFSQHGDLLMFQTQRLHGKLLATTFGMEREETNWPLHPSFVPFLDLCLQSVRTEHDWPVQFEPGEQCVWNLPPDHSWKTLSIRAGNRELTRVPVTGNRVEFRVPSEPGLYDVTWDGESEAAHVLQVNPSPLESRLTYRSAKELVASWTLQDHPAAATPSATLGAIDLTRAEVLGQTWWWWFLLGGVMLLFGETLWTSLISVRRSRSSEN